MSNRGRVLIAAPVHQVLLDGLKKAGYECLMQEKINQQTAPELIAGCVGVVTSTRLQLDKTLIDAAPDLQWIGRMGSGMEVIDVPYAESRGIKCVSSPEGNCNAVGEHALGMLLSLVRRISWSNQEIKNGLWLREENRGTELEGKTIGIIGYGHTGKAFIKKLQGFDMRILVYDKYPQKEMPDWVERCEDLTPIYEQADIISFHVPLQKDTIHYFDDNFMAKMTRGFILINTSRGIVVDTKTVWKGLNTGKIRGICMDVWEQEPLEKMDENMRQTFDKIAGMQQAVITPHIAGYSTEALFKMSEILLYKIINA